MVELGAIYRLCVSVCLRVCVSVCPALLKKVVSPGDCKISKWISLAQATNDGNSAVWDGLITIVTVDRERLSQWQNNH